MKFLLLKPKKLITNPFSDFNKELFSLKHHLNDVEEVLTNLVDEFGPTKFLLVGEGAGGE